MSDDPRLEPMAAPANLYRLDGDKYVEEATAEPGQRLRFTAPIVAEVDPASLGE